MRRLVACNACKRQYDASRLDVGCRFHCACGEEVEVIAPHGHEASIVRCSNCGAPRESDASECNFCRADFTLHERDLHTVCPACLARISDRARFCHHCGGAITADLAAEAATELACPRCQNGTLLVSRRIGEYQTTVLECPRCTGMWLGLASFDQLTANAAQQARTSDSMRGPRQAVQQHRGPAPTAPPSGGSFYRPCPVCEKLMPRKNYSRYSGVIVDVCRNHGTWLDANELPQILAWIRAGGNVEAQRRNEEQKKNEQYSKRMTNRSPAAAGWDPNQAYDDPVSDIVSAAFSMLSQMFR